MVGKKTASIIQADTDAIVLDRDVLGTRRQMFERDARRGMRDGAG